MGFAGRLLKVGQLNLDRGPAAKILGISNLNVLLLDWFWHFVSNEQRGASLNAMILIGVIIHF